MYNYLEEILKNVELPVKSNSTASSINIDNIRYQLCFITHEPWEMQLTYQLNVSQLMFAFSTDVTKIFITVSLPNNYIYKVSTYTKDGKRGDINFGINRTISISLNGLLVFQHIPTKEYEFEDINKCKLIDLKQGELIP